MLWDLDQKISLFIDMKTNVLNITVGNIQSLVDASLKITVIGCILVWQIYIPVFVGVLELSSKSEKRKRAWTKGEWQSKYCIVVLLYCIIVTICVSLQMDSKKHRIFSKSHQQRKQIIRSLRWIIYNNYKSKIHISGSTNFNLYFI